MLYKAKNLEGYQLLSHDGAVGKVKDFYFDDKHWTVRYLVADTAYWLAGRKVLISPYALQNVNKIEQSIVVDLSKNQIENSPSWDCDKPVSRQYEELYHQHYGWPLYWKGPSIWGESPIIDRVRNESKEVNLGGKAWDHHLRSTDVVSGYDIQAADGYIGHIQDFIIDDATWTIRYLIVDTQNWLPGKKVLISPLWIESVNWDSSKVVVKINREAIKISPEYTDETLMNRNYEAKLHGHYNCQGYWVNELPPMKHVG